MSSESKRTVKIIIITFLVISTWFIFSYLVSIIAKKLGIDSYFVRFFTFFFLPLFLYWFVTRKNRKSGKELFKYVAKKLNYHYIGFPNLKIIKHLRCGIGCFFIPPRKIIQISSNISDGIIFYRTHLNFPDGNTSLLVPKTYFLTKIDRPLPSDTFLKIGLFYLGLPISFSEIKLDSDADRDKVEETFENSFAVDAVKIADHKDEIKELYEMEKREGRNPEHSLVSLELKQHFVKYANFAKMHSGFHLEIKNGWMLFVTEHAQKQDLFKLYCGYSTHAELEMFIDFGIELKKIISNN